VPLQASRLVTVAALFRMAGHYLAEEEVKYAFRRRDWFSRRSWLGGWQWLCRIMRNDK